MTEKKIEFRLHSKQMEVWGDSSRFRVLVAGRRFGKTTLAVTELIVSALANDTGLYWLVAPTYRQAKMIAWRLLKNLIPEEITTKFNEAELSATFPNGAVIELKGADNEDSLRGTGIWGMVVDEYAVIYNKWAVWNEVLRPALTDKQGWCLFIGTPKGKDALWELYMKGQRNEDEFKSWQFKTEQNPFINPDEIIKAKQELPPRYFRQEYEASFEDYTGLVWPEFNKSHITSPIYLDKLFKRIGAIDPAVSGTTGALKCAIDEDGILWFYEEYYEANRRISEVCEAIRSDVHWLIDPSSRAKNVLREGKLYSLFNEYTDNGIYAELGEHDVDAGINRVAEYFKKGKIRIFDTLKHFIWELERYHWTEEKETSLGIPKPKPYKANDHLCDCLRYIVMSRVKGEKIVYTPKVEKGSVAYEIEAIEREARDWRAKYK